MRSLRKFFKRTNNLVAGWGQGVVEGFFHFNSGPFTLLV